MNTHSETNSVTIRITGKEINARLQAVETSVRVLKYAAAIELPILLVILGKLLL